MFVANLNTLLERLIFFDVFGFPFLIFIAIISFIFFNIGFGFVSIRLFRHGIDVVRGKFSSPDDPGLVTHSQAIYTAALSTVGLGSVAGVAIAITIGGPGAIFWLIVAGFLGMSAKFAEVALGHKYRVFSADGVVSGGPFLYMKNGLTDIGFPKIGKILGFTYAVTMVFTSFGASNMFQTNQTAMVIMNDFNVLASHPFIVGLIIVLPIAVVIIGDVRGIAKLAGAVVPYMTIFYVFSVFVVLGFHYKNILPSLKFIFVDAFDQKSATGGIIGAMVIGFSRAVFATESGGGTAAIAHAPSKTKEHIREGCTVFIEIILALFVCLATGLVVVCTGVYEQSASCGGGVLLTKMAFESAHKSFSSLLTVAVYFLAITTTIGWGYYGVVAWSYMFRGKGVFIYKILYVIVAFYGVISSDIVEIVRLSDYAWSIVMFPNIIALLFMFCTIRKDLKDYVNRYKAGEFHKNK